MNNDASSVLWRRLLYMLTPQLDIYEGLRRVVGGKKVLEVGFGTGIGVMQYAAFAEYVDAVELDQAAVEFARRCLPVANARWLHDDITKPTRNYRGYDFVVCIEVLEHVSALDAALRNIANSLAIGGAGILTVPNSLRYRRRSEALNVTEWEPAGFLALLKEHFAHVRLLDSTLFATNDLQHRESPIVVGVHRGR